MDGTPLAAAADSAVSVEGLFELLGLVVIVAVVAALGRRVQVAGPILLVLVGFLLSYVPGVPDYRIDPNVVLLLFLPPLLYAAAWRTSNRSFRSNLRPIGLLSVGLVLFTTLVVGLVAWAVVPGLQLSAAFALGAVVAPPDAVAATAVARRSGLPRRVVTILEGESLLNDATALTTLRVAIAAAASSVTLLDFAWEFAVAALGGALIGLVTAWVAAQLHRRNDEPVLDVVLSVLTPFTSYLLAEAVGASGVVAVVSTGLWLSQRWYRLFSPASRTLATPLWNVADFLLTGVVFALIGLELPAIVSGIEGTPAGTVVVGAVAVTLAVVLSRPIWVFPATYLARLVPRVRRRDPAPPWQYPAVISWAGMRGVVSLAAALACSLALVALALRPLHALEDTAARVWRGDLAARVPPSPLADAAVARVGDAFNAMLDRLARDRARMAELTAEVIRAGEAERARLGGELHESAAQTLAAAVYELSAARRALGPADGSPDGPPADPAAAAAGLAAAHRLAADALDEVQALARGMRAAPRAGSLSFPDVS